MLGVILCGGQSERMGRDKGLLMVKKKNWAQHACDILQQLNLSVTISINSQQFDDYSRLFNPDQLTVDNGTFTLKGPLCGVLSVHLKYPEQDLFVLACDMPNMEITMLKELIDHFDSDPQSGAYLFTNNHQPEPLCAIYKSASLRNIYQMYIANTLPRHSMKFALEQMMVSIYPISENQKIFFRNYNSHAEINGL